MLLFLLLDASSTDVMCEYARDAPTSDSRCADCRSRNMSGSGQLSGANGRSRGHTKPVYIEHPLSRCLHAFQLDNAAQWLQNRNELRLLGVATVQCHTTQSFSSFGSTDDILPAAELNSVRVGYPWWDGSPSGNDICPFSFVVLSLPLAESPSWPSLSEWVSLSASTAMSM